MIAMEIEADLAAANAKLADAVAALETIAEGPQPISNYLHGIRCGVEDRGLQNSAYEAAEYGYERGLEYSQDIATRALAPAVAERPPFVGTITEAEADEIQRSGAGEVSIILQPADGVVVPIETLIIMRAAITEDSPLGKRAIAAYEKLKAERRNLLAAAQELRK